ncbi:hypothetical protein KA005_43515 [bacterium]|nr:hypothetical protein [bacterium]
MNKKQKICLWIGIIAFAFVGLCSQMGNIYTSNTVADTIVYISRLLVRWVIVGVITGGLMYTFRDKKPKADQKITKSGQSGGNR